jgi:CRISPR-associated Csx2 family protein
MQKIITFLGTNIPFDSEKNEKVITTYLHNGKAYDGYVFPQALRQFADFDKMLVFVTKQAKESTWPVLEGLEDPRIKPIDIPIGETTAEMWAIFDQIIEQVDEGDSVIFDITHGLRSIPFLMFLFAAFLKFARGVTIKSVYYGALELGNHRKGVPAPVFDLSEFVNMLDWLTAADRFVETGDGQLLSKLLKDEMPPGIQMGKDINFREIGNHLKQSADEIENISKALLMTRPVELMASGAKISGTFQTTTETLEEQARPYIVLGEKIEKTYSKFGLENPLNTQKAKSHLIQSKDLIAWYLNHQQASNACLMMREWMVSAVMAMLGFYPFNDFEKRMLVENIFHKAKDKIRKHGDQGEKYFPPELKNLTDPLCFIKFWQKITNLRNDNAHCGYREHAKTASQLINDASNYYKEFDEISKDVLSLLD